MDSSPDNRASLHQRRHSNSASTSQPNSNNHNNNTNTVPLSPSNRYPTNRIKEDNLDQDDLENGYHDHHYDAGYYSTDGMATNSMSSMQPPIVLKGGHSFNLLSQWFFLPVFALLKRSRTDRYFDPDSIALQESEMAGNAGAKLGECWKQEVLDHKKRASISRALAKAFGRRYLMLALYKLFWIIFTYVGAYYLVKQLIIFVEKGEDRPLDEMKSESSTDGYLYAVGLLLTSVFSTVCIHQVMAECTRIGVQVRAGLMVMIYRKSLKLSSAQGSVGNIINLISNDCNRIAESFVNFHFLWSSALEILVVIILAFTELQIAATPALVILILLFPVQYYLSLLMARISSTTTSLTTARIHLMSELLTAIKLIKFYAWESYFRERVTKVRSKEMAAIRKGMNIKITSFAIVFAAPVLTTLACMTVYELTNHRGADGLIKASVVFTILSLFNTLRYPLIMLPIAVRTTMGAILSFDRLNAFFMSPEVSPLNAIEPTKSNASSDGSEKKDAIHFPGAGLIMGGGIGNGMDEAQDAREAEKEARRREIESLRIYIKNADFGWEESNKVTNPTLSFVSLSVKPGQLVALVGDVGAGKSSLLAAIMGQIRLLAGDRSVHGSLAYVPHEAWLLNATLKENILFGQPYNRQKYRQVISACALDRDLTLLSGGDETEIGERGINLSHGQRQRVSLARAIYSDADIMLLDDPLMGMDPLVGRHIFQECIRGYLAQKTVIYVTNQHQYLARCDQIVVMKGGSVEDTGTFDELMAKDVNLKRMMEEDMEIEDTDVLDELVSEIRLEPAASNIGSGGPSGSSNRPLSSSSEKSPIDHATTQKSVTYQTPMPGLRFPDSEKKQNYSDLEDLNSITIHDRLGKGKGNSTGPRQLGLLDAFSPKPPQHQSLSSPSGPSYPLTSRSPSQSFGVASGGGTGGGGSSNIAANEQTIHRLRELNSHTIQNQALNEQTISRIIERNQMTILGSIGQNRLTTVPSNREENSMARAVERNQLTIHSLAGRDGGMMGVGDNGDNLDLGYGVKRRDEISGWSVAKAYLRKANGMGVSLAVVLVFVATHGLRIFSDYWLRFTVGEDAKLDYQYYLSVYGGLVLAVVIGAFLRGFFLSWTVLKKSVTYHDRIFRKIMRAPMSYFDVTPLGRILNVFARHLYVVDEVLPDSALQMLQYMPMVIGATILVIIIEPWSAIAVVILCGVSWILIHASSQTDERLKAMEAVTKGPIFAHMAATLDGLFSIRVYNAESRFDGFNLSKIDDNHKALFGMMQVRAWQAFYLDLVASVFVFATAVVIVYFGRNSTSLDGSLAGLAVTNALQLLIFGQWSVRMVAEVRSTRESVYQLELYGMNIPAEAPDVILETQPPQEWPIRGEIEFKQVVLRYQNYGVAVLKRVSFVIRSGQKIGVVGKMGSGKTTLLISLLRVVEAAEGQILIDGVDVKEIGLRDLRSKIAIIPQEPVLFVGTIRSNLDPFSIRTDQEIWDALDAVHLSESIRVTMPARLETVIVENGKNFSLGQRQLFCIARAILFQSRILVLDEATSHVDAATDQLVQATIKQNFANCTVLMIAHRLTTIAECDKVLVLDSGRVAQFDKPDKLIEEEGGCFHGLVSQSGPHAVDRLKTLMREHQEQRQGGTAGNEEERPVMPTINVIDTSPQGLKPAVTTSSSMAASAAGAAQGTASSSSLTSSSSASSSTDSSSGTSPQQLLLQQQLQQQLQKKQQENIKSTPAAGSLRDVFNIPTPLTTTVAAAESLQTSMERDHSSGSKQETLSKGSTTDSSLSSSPAMTRSSSPSIAQQPPTVVTTSSTAAPDTVEQSTRAPSPSTNTPTTPQAAAALGGVAMTLQPSRGGVNGTTATSASAMPRSLEDVFFGGGQQQQ